MNAPTTRKNFDIEEIDAALESEQAEKKAATRKRRKAFLIFGAVLLKATAAYAGYA